MAALHRIGWFVALLTIGIVLAVVTCWVMAVGVLVGTHKPYRQGWTFGVEKMED